MTKLAIRDPKTPIAKGIAVGTNSPPMPAMGAVRNPPRAPIQRSGIARPSPRRAVMMPATPAPIAPIVAPIGQLLKSPMRALMLAAIRPVIPAPSGEGCYSVVEEGDTCANSLANDASFNEVNTVRKQASQHVAY